MGEYVLVQDCDTHWYIVPAEKQTEAADYFKKVYHYWNYAFVGPNDNPPEEPSWLIETGGSPSLVKFSNWRID